MVVDPSSEQKMVNYQRLLADANELFDLWWLNEELTKLLFSSKQKMAFTDFVRWHQSWEENADLYFASSYLLSYREVLREMTANSRRRLSTAPSAGRYQPSTSSVCTSWIRMPM